MGLNFDGNSITFSDGTVQTIAFSGISITAGSGIQVEPSGTNFTISSSGTIGGSSMPTVVQLGSVDGSVYTSAASGDIFNLTIITGITLENPTDGIDGKSLRWRITQPAEGSGTVTLGDKFNTPTSATTPLVWSTSGNYMDMLGATYDATRDKWDIVAFVPGYN